MQRSLWACYIVIALTGIITIWPGPKKPEGPAVLEPYEEETAATALSASDQNVNAT
jgi:hypothetical protein